MGLRFLAWAVVTAAAALAAASSDSLARATPDARLFFSSVRDHDALEIFSISANGGALRRESTSVPFGNDPSWSPDGSKLAFEATAYASAIWVVNVDGSSPRRLVASGQDPAWSPDGRTIAFASGQEIKLLELETGNVRTLFRGPAAYADPSWSPDGARLTFARPGLYYPGSTDEGEVYVVDRDSGGARVLTSGAEPAWSPDGRLIAFTRIHHFVGVPSFPYYGRLWLVTVDGGNETELALPPSGSVGTLPLQSPAWSPDGSRLVAEYRFGPYGHLYLVELAGGGSVRRFGAGDGRLGWFGTRAAWSPDGQTIASALAGQIQLHTLAGEHRQPLQAAAHLNPTTTRLGALAFQAGMGFDESAVWLAPRAGEPAARLLEKARHPALSPDGRTLAVTRTANIDPFGAPFLGPVVFLLDPKGNGLRRLHRGEWPAWSPDGKQIALSLRNGLTVVGASGKLVRRLTSPLPTATPFISDASPSWSPDGRKLAFTRTVRCSNAAPDCMASESVYTIPAKGGQARKLADGSDPAWSPDGCAIAFVSMRDGDAELYLMGASGGSQRRLTGHPGADLSPSWQPPRVPRAPRCK